MSENNTQTRTLVMFSGGMDSFLAACRRVDKGDYVGLISFNNGAVAAEKNILHGVQRLINRYGSDRIHFEGIYGTRATIWGLEESYVNSTLTQIAEKLPHCPPAQIMCFHCQTAMWLAAIAWAKMHDFTVICSGYLDTDTFCTGSKSFIQQVTALANRQGITVVLPVWETPKTRPWDVEKVYEMGRRCFQPAVLEPQCMLGVPTLELTPEMEKEMQDYFNSDLLEVALKEIEELKGVFRLLPLDMDSSHAISYPVPDPSYGVF